MTPIRLAGLRLPPEASAPGRARSFVEAVCRRWSAPEFAVDGGLVVSELVTNAVRHAGTAIVIRLVLGEGGLTVRVADQGPGVPHVVPPDERLVGGRGLAIVEELADAWGVDADRGGKAVWCFLRTRIPVGTPGP